MNNWKNIEFSGEELGHYSRHLSIPEIGMEGQKKLKAARVLAVGTGGLGAPLLQYLRQGGSQQPASPGVVWCGRCGAS